MSLRNLPDIKALDMPALDFAPDDTVMARWNPAVRAAVEGDGNVISIYDVIGADLFGDGGVTTKRVAAALRRIGDQDVTVNINSPGGDFFEGTGIYALLREHPRKVTVKIMGLAASAASVIAMAGDEVLISEVGFMMVHNAWAIALGNRHDFRDAADRLEPFDDAMASLYAARAGVDKSEAASWMDAETWFNGGQAVEAGLADGLLGSDETTEAGDDAPRSLAAQRRVEAILTRQGMPRSERKRLFSEMKGYMPGAVAEGGKPGAAVTAMPGAGDEVVADLDRLISIIQP